MKQTFIWVLLLVAFAGLVYWFGSQDTADVPGAPVAETTDTAEQPAPGATNEYVGKTEVEAEATATQNGVPFRVVERDGEMLPTTRDFREGRINAVVEGGVVTSYTVESLEASPEVPEETGGSAAGQHNVIIGMTEAEAEAYAEANEVSFRIGSVDGEALPVTMDYRPGRITAVVVAGVVTGYTVE